MSGPSTLSNDSIASSSPDADAQHAPDDARPTRPITAPLQFVGFWIAIVLPFVHVPLLANGLGSLEDALLFVGLLALNLVALYVGHGYRRP